MKRSLAPLMALGSPVSNDGRGLKRGAVWANSDCAIGSPVSNDGRGLKHKVKDAICVLPGFARQQ